MNRKNTSLKAMRVKIINISLYPVENQRVENYINLFNKIHLDKVTIKTYGDRYTRIRTLFNLENNIIHGFFSNSVFINPKDDALDTETNEIVPSNVDPKKGLGLKNWEYFFFPEHHRLVIDDRLPLQQIIKFLNEAIKDYYTKDEYNITVEVSTDVINEIITSEALTKLFVRVTYSNNDNYDGWSGIIDEQFKDGCVKNVILNASGTKKNPINISNSPMLQGYVQLSSSNGFTEAVVLENDGSGRTIRTDEHPLVKTIQYAEDPLPALKELVNTVVTHEELSN